MTAIKSALVQKLIEPRNISILVYFRIIFGAIMIWEVFRYFDHDWIADYWIDPVFHFTYYGFGWVKPLPGDLMYVHFIVMGIAAACMMIGFQYRIASIAFFVLFSWMFLAEQTRYLNHFYLVCLISFVLMFVPANRALSVDSLLNKKIRTNYVPGWSLWALRCQVGVPYFFGGIAKINEDWLRAEPLRSWLSERADTFPLLGQYFTEEWFVYLFSYGSLFVDLFAVPFLLWRKTRIPMYVILVSFHLINFQLFNIGIFPWFMIFATLIFFEPDWPQKLTRFKIPQKPQFSIRPLTKNQKIIVSLFCIFLIFNFAMPLRHYAYPGEVNWTEEGHNFSWHMKLRDKDTMYVEFIAVDPVTDEEWYIDPHDELSDRQVSKMSKRPDMILQYAHFLADQFRNDGYPEIEIYADVEILLNDRPPQYLIDPNVDLAKQPITIAPKSWIVPLENYS